MKNNYYKGEIQGNIVQNMPSFYIKRNEGPKNGNHGRQKNVMCETSTYQGNGNSTEGLHQ